MYSSPTKGINEHKITQNTHAYFMFVWNTSCAAVNKMKNSQNMRDNCAVNIYDLNKRVT